MKSHKVIIVGIVLAAIVILIRVGGPANTAGDRLDGHVKELAVVTSSSEPIARPPVILLEPEIDAPPSARFAAVIELIHWRESRNGEDENCLVEGPDGELGESGIREIFVEEVYRISGFRIDRLDNTSCEKGIAIWLAYWVPRVFPQGLASLGPASMEDIYELYRRGPTGYREWREAKETMAAISQASDEIGQLW